MFILVTAATVCSYKMKVCGALAGTVSYRLYKVPSSQFIVQLCLKPLRLSNEDNPTVLLQSGIVYDPVHVRGDYRF